VRGKFFESGRIANAETNSAALVGGDEPRTLERVYASHGRGKRDAERLGKLRDRHGTAPAKPRKHLAVHLRAEHVEHEGGVFSRVSCRISDA